ncbi:GGDEF domain-containing protein [Pantoea sp. SIMBA_079]|uniref:GGDEF domain-containing protein n=1 Tax=Pantoea sp. SIMBA_079 TaxID=3085817 RepID=UPI0028DAFE8E|nr:GGDEF domain-containing protein [uncultured Pantoea sp.]
MTLDIYTLFVCELYVLGFLSIIMIFAWVGAQYDRVLGFTTLTLILTLCAVFLSSLRSAGLHFLPVALGNVIVMLAYGTLLCAFRTFCQRPVGLLWPGGALLWALLCLLPGFYHGQPQRVLVLCLLCILYTAAFIMLLWRARSTLKVTFWPAQTLLWIHLGFHLARIFLDDAVVSRQPGAIGGSGFSIYVILESILFVIGLTFTLLAMVNERSQVAHKLASLRDPLTGAWNRRALFEQADNVRRRRARLSPADGFSAVLFDLDHFKNINDRYGHLQGDRVLIDFCQIAEAHMPAESYFARLGGEEFAALVTGDSEQVRQVCEAIRQATQRSQPAGIGYTVSIGYATASPAASQFPALLALADEALYCAKARGRNRTEYAFPAPKAVAERVS